MATARVKDKVCDMSLEVKCRDSLRVRVTVSALST